MKMQLDSKHSAKIQSGQKSQMLSAQLVNGLKLCRVLRQSS